MEATPVSPRPGVSSPGVEDCVERALSKVGKRVVLALPLGIGKPNQLVNEFVRRAREDSTIELTILTALTLRVPQVRGELERRLMGPIRARLFGDLPALDYDELLHAGRLPENVTVSEFYLAPGARMRDARSQQAYGSSNYTQVVRDGMERGINVLAQMVGVDPSHDPRRYSLSSNTDITLDLLPRLSEREAAGQPTAVVAQVNRRLPFMAGDAALGPEAFDAIVDDPALDFEPFATPNEPISLADAAIGLYASTLVRDGGTIQLGIGALGDAITHALVLREKQPTSYRAVLEETGVLERRGDMIDRWGGTGPFEKGLYASTEMLVDGLLELQRAGVLRRRVQDHPFLQELAEAGELPEAPTLELIERMANEGQVSHRLSRRCVEDLARAGILRPDVTWRAGRLIVGGREVSAELDDPDTRSALRTHGLREHLRGTLIHAGFFLGPQRMYAALRELDPELREAVRMTSISFTNELVGDEALKRAQRCHARFLNSGLMTTLLGAVVSDGLADGRVISGVGGQHDFVCMAQDLEGARSVILIRSTRENRGRVESNVVWNYGHTTIPRHLRDVVVTEYGIADLRGRCDREVIEALLEVSDARFQEGLARAAIEAGKLPRGYRLPDRARANTPEQLERSLGPPRAEGLLPRLPFGSVMTEVEWTLAADLRALSEAWKGRRGLLPGRREIAACLRAPADASPYLERMDLERPAGLRGRILRLATLFALARRGSIGRSV